MYPKEYTKRLGIAGVFLNCKYIVFLGNKIILIILIQIFMQGAIIISITTLRITII